MDCPPGCMAGIGALRGTDESRAVVEGTAAFRRAAQEAIERRIKRAVAEGELAAETNAKTLAAYYSTVVQGMSVQAQDVIAVWARVTHVTLDKMDFKFTSGRTGFLRPCQSCLVCRRSNDSPVPDLI